MSTGNLCEADISETEDSPVEHRFETYQAKNPNLASVSVLPQSQVPALDLEDIKVEGIEQD